MEPFNLKETRRRDFEISPAKYISRTIVLARVITNMRIYLFFSTTKIKILINITRHIVNIKFISTERIMIRNVFKRKKKIKTLKPNKTQ